MRERKALLFLRPYHRPDKALDTLIHSLIHSFIQLSNYYVPGTWDSSENQRDLEPYPHGVCILAGGSVLKNKQVRYVHKEHRVGYR